MAETLPSTAPGATPADPATTASPPPETRPQQTTADGSSSAASPSTARKRSRSPDAPQPDPSPSRKRPRAAIDEKTRTRRLFGGLLSGPGPRAARTDHSSRSSGGNPATGPSEATLARRASIEARKRSELAARDEEIAVMQKAKLAELHRRRRRRQVLLDERDKEREWDARVLRAGFLRTRGEGGIYFSPWKMTEEQEDEVRERKAEVEKEVEEDRERWRADKASRDAEARDDGRDVGDAEMTRGNGGADSEREKVEEIQEETDITVDDQKETLENGGGAAAEELSAKHDMENSAMQDPSTTQLLPEERKHRSGSPSPSEDEGQDGVDNGEDRVMY